MKIPVEKIEPNPRQPRTQFDEEGLQVLAGSLKEHGLVQAITVEERPEEGGYWLIAGERRWRAARMLEWDEIEAHVVPSMNGQGDRRRLAMALVENIHREQMDPVDTGQAYQDLKDTGLTNKEVARMVGKSESNVWLYRTILKFEPEIQELYRAGQMPIDHRIIHLLRKLTPEQRLALIPRLKKPGLTVAKASNLLKTSCCTARSPAGARACWTASGSSSPSSRPARRRRCAWAPRAASKTTPSTKRPRRPASSAISAATRSIRSARPARW